LYKNWQSNAMMAMAMVRAELANLKEMSFMYLHTFADANYG
jgi:hypothetical protein